MSTWINVPRYHLVQRINYGPAVGGLGLAFAADLFIWPSSRPGTAPTATSAVWPPSSSCCSSSACRRSPDHYRSNNSWLSRASYYLGTVGLAVALSAVYSLILAIGQVIERATGGWGIKMGFFRVPCVLQGP